MACNTADRGRSRRPPAELPVPVLDVVEPGRTSARADHPDRPCRRDRHGRHGVVGCLRAGDRRHRGAGVAHERGVPRLRRVRRTRPDHRRRGDRARRTPAGPDARRRRRRAAARLHPLSVPRPHDQRRDGARASRSSARPTRRRSPCATGSSSSASSRPTSRVGRHRFVSSGDVDTFRELGSRLLGPELDHTEHWEPPAAIRSSHDRPDPNRRPP